MNAPNTRPPFRIASSRDLVIAIGPTAAAAIEAGHADLELVDVAIVDADPAVIDPAQLAVLGDIVLEYRSAVVSLFDGRDEAWWPVAAYVTAMARGRATLPTMFAYSDPRPRHSERCTMLRRLARRLDACVIEAPHEPGGLLRAGLLPIVGLRRTGLTGFDSAALAVVLRAPSIGHAGFFADVTTEVGDDGWSRARARLSEPGITHVLITIRCGPRSKLHDINILCSRIADVVPDVEILLATPMQDMGVRDELEASILALRENGE